MHSDKSQRLLKDSLWEYNCFVTLSLLRERTNTDRELTPWNMSTGIHQNPDSAKHIRTFIPSLYYKTIKNMVKHIPYAYHLIGGKSSHLFRCQDSLQYRPTIPLLYCHMFSVDDERIFTNFSVVFILILLKKLQDNWKFARIQCSQLCPQHSVSSRKKQSSSASIHVSQKYLPKLRCKSIHTARV